MSNASTAANRPTMLARLAAEPFDLIVVGGGATGLGVAVDAVLRGARVALLESHDFAKGTSSRATKLIHGGVRYLGQGRIALVRESLHERSTLLRNAPGLVRPMPFIVPAYRSWELPFYGAGLSVYSALAGRHSLGPTRLLGANAVSERLPGVRRFGLKGGVEYWDAQFDDAGLAVALACAAADRGAVMLNYFPVSNLLHENGKVVGVQAVDAETQKQYSVRASCVVNACGVWVDELRRRDAHACGKTVQALIRASRGTHLVVDRSFFPSEAALLVPRTADGRVLFIVPWMGKVLLGTTDIEAREPVFEPQPDPAEIDYILNEVARYLHTPPTRQDVKSVWAGLRPLVDPSGSSQNAPRRRGTATRQVSREHAIEISHSGLLTVAGGKWTTYRAMAQDVVEACIGAGLLPKLAPCSTHAFSLSRGAWSSTPDVNTISAPLDQTRNSQLEAAGVSASFVTHVGRHEYARTVEDVLARRSRSLFLDADAAISVAPIVARILQEETGVCARLTNFLQTAQHYQVPL